MSFKRDSKGKFSFEGRHGDKRPAKKGWLQQLGIRDTSDTQSIGDDASSMVSSSFHSNASDAEDESIMESIIDDPDAGSMKVAAKQMNKFVKKQAKAFVRNFIDYGPPYKVDGPFDPILVNECARPVINLYDLHKFLNMRMDPNRADPEDLYYTPVHWVARNAHMLALRMLRRAGAKLNITNEMGHTPLDMCVMIKHPPDKRKEQMKMAIYMLENGADPNSRDKGGFSAIDHAAANQDAEMIALLIEFGAKVLRGNTIFVGPRAHILKDVHDPECYKLLYEQLLIEEGDAERKRIERERIEFEKELDRKHVKLHVALDKRKEKRLMREQQREAAQRRGEVASDREQNLKEEMERNLRARERKKASHGLWRLNSIGNWEFHPRALEPISSELMYQKNLNLIESLFQGNKYDKFNTRWDEITSGGDIEVPWKRSEPFAVCLPKIERRNVMTEKKTEDLYMKTVDERDIHNPDGVETLFDDEDHSFAAKRTGLEDLESLCTIDSLGTNLKGSNSRFELDETIRKRKSKKKSLLDPEIRNIYDQQIENEAELDDIIQELRRF